MAKCPKCHIEIDHLRAYSLEENVQNVSLEGGELDWSTSDVVDESCVQIEFECPHCNQVIYKNRGDSTDPEIKRLLQPSP
jgi:hypothetical protein